MLYACGPEGMLAATATVAPRYGRPCQVSVERVMGCGLGGCYSCVVPMRGDDGQFHHVRSCLAGPVLAGRSDSVGLMDLSVQIGSLTLKNPLIAASGCFGYGVEYADMVDLASLGGVAVKGLFLNEREGHPAPRIVETPAGMLNAIGLQGIGVRRFIDEKLPELRARRRDGHRQHLRHDARRVRRGGAHPVGRRGRRRARAEHLVPEHQGRRHPVRLQPDGHLRCRQRRPQGHPAADHPEADAERHRRRLVRARVGGRRRRRGVARQHVSRDGHRRGDAAAEDLERRRAG